MRRRQLLLLAIAIFAACSGSGDSGDSGNGGTPRAPYVAEPADGGLVGNLAFLQGVPALDGGGWAGPGSANVWDLDADLSLVDGHADQFDFALWLAIGNLPTKPASYDSIDVDAWDLAQLLNDQTYARLTFYEPTVDAPTGAAIANGFGYGSPLAGAYSAYLSPSGDSRLSQTVDLTNAHGTVTLSWMEDVEVTQGRTSDGIGGYCRAVVRSASTGEVLATASSAGGFGSRSLDLTAFAGERVSVSFELRTWADGFAGLDQVSITDEDGNELVANGAFEAGTLSGWTSDASPQSQNVVSASRTVAGLEVTRGFYTAPGSAWARWVDVFRNPGTSAVTTDVVYMTDLGSDDAGVIYDTPGAAGRAISSWDGTGADRDLALVYGIGTSFHRSASALGTHDGSELVYVLHTITVPAGGRIALVHYVVMSGSATGSTATSLAARATAVDQMAAAIASGVGNDPVFLDWLTAEQAAAPIANW